MNFGDMVKAVGFEQAINYMNKEPETNIPKLEELVNRSLTREEFAEQLQAVMLAMKVKTLDVT
jgi:hypothetical protein